MPAWAMISCASGSASTSRSRLSAIGGSPRPPWMRIGTRRSAAIAKTGVSRSSSSRNFCARGCSLMPRAPRSRQRSASSIGASARSSRTNGIMRPFERSAKASVRSLPALKPGCRSGSSRQKTLQRETPKRSSSASSSSYRPTMPSMSLPRWVCASKMSAPTGSSLRSSTSNPAKSSCARSSGSVTLGIYPRGLFEGGREDPVEEDPLRHGAVPLRHAVDDDARHRPDVHLASELRELRRLDRGGADARRGESRLVRQQHGRRAMRSGGRDEDVDREVLLERGQPFERLRLQRRLAQSRLQHGEDQRAELVAPRQPVVADADVLTLREHGDRRLTTE